MPHDSIMQGTPESGEEFVTMVDGVKAKFDAAKKAIGEKVVGQDQVVE